MLNLNMDRVRERAEFNGPPEVISDVSSCIFQLDSMLNIAV